MCSKFLPKTYPPLPLLPPSRQKNSSSLGRSRVGGLCRVVEKDSNRESELDIDQDKAREALRQLDQQLESFSRKKIPSPKIKASEVKWTSDEMMSEDVATDWLLSGPFLSYLTVGLVLFTVFYNLLFYTVIKPSIDGPDYASEAPIGTGSPPEEKVLNSPRITDQESS